MRTVLANGVFDVLHIGHLDHLQAARKMGDRLIVGVTVDEAVNKGPGRPVFSVFLRIRMLEALRCVDRAFYCRSALDALRGSKPDIFVKGIEYQGKIEKEDEDYCRDNGIEIRFTNERAFSSTKLLHYYDRP